MLGKIHYLSLYHPRLLGPGLSRAYGECSTYLFAYKPAPAWARISALRSTKKLDYYL